MPASLQPLFVLVQGTRNTARGARVDWEVRNRCRGCGTGVLKDGGVAVKQKWAGLRALQQLALAGQLQLQ